MPLTTSGALLTTIGAVVLLVSGCDAFAPGRTHFAEPRLYEGRRVTLRFTDNPEVGSRVVFSLTPDEESVDHHPSGTRWTRKPGEEAVLAESTCT